MHRVKLSHASVGPQGQLHYSQTSQKPEVTNAATFSSLQLCHQEALRKVTPQSRDSLNPLKFYLLQKATIVLAGEWARGVTRRWPWVPSLHPEPNL